MSRKYLTNGLGIGKDADIRDLWRDVDMWSLAGAAGPDATVFSQLFNRLEGNA